MAFDPDYALFVAVADAGSLSATARALRLSPAMVSKRLQKLEQRLGVTLVHRTTRRLALTTAGERFRTDLGDILGALDAAEARVTGARTAPAGPLHVSAPTSFGRLHVAPHLGRFVAACPAVELRFDLDDGFVDLFGARVDCAIRIAAEVPANVVAHRLATSRRILCAAPSYLAGSGTPQKVDDLSAHRLLAADGQMPWRLVSGGRTTLVTEPSHVRTNSSEMVRELALGGVGIALRSLWDVGDALASGQLVRVLPEWEGSADVGIYAVHLRSPAVPAAVTAFIGFLRDTIDPAAWT
ncbi:LysR family transcriptional regulator [Arthrobacter sp. TPD3018]|uniref:LysR family transcriptional regulator n=1 Tax=Bacteria TaxID=2 RepID=UPI000D517E5D|nr:MULTISPECIES: LysR family transcriptional regulator [Bacteria]PVE60182.1 LysR family transcriptional regulator [Sphingomonas sp. TPD3009]PVE61696.1 LysR family transcriptional regulator [Arthrobacter sp. TPD3018]PVE85387.1 LysR family transcriptional regulator [Sphingomonas melonis]